MLLLRNQQKKRSYITYTTQTQHTLTLHALHAQMFFLVLILTGKGQVRFYADDHSVKRVERYEAKPPSFDDYRWKHKKDATRSTNNETQQNYHYLVMGG